MANQELLDWIFTLRLSLMDTYYQEKDVILELKYFLKNNKNIVGDECNQLLKQFYQKYNVPIPDEFIESIVIPQPANYPPLNFQINPQQQQEEDDDSLPELDEPDLEDDNNLPDLDEPDEIPAGLPYVQIPQNFNMVLQINGNTYGYDPITGGMQLISGQNNAPSSINYLQPPNLSINNQQQIMQMFNQMFNSFQNIQPVQPQEDILVTCDKNDLEQLKEFDFKFVDSKPNTQKEVTTCAICKCDFEENEKLTETPCKHTFHSACINYWLDNKSNKCPVCRKECGKAHAHT